MERIGRTPTKVQELVYELRIKQVMSSELIMVEPDWPMAQVKEMMRTGASRALRWWRTASWWAWSASSR